MRVAFVLMLTVGFGTGCAPEPRDLAQLTAADSLYVDPETGDPFSGPVVRYFEAPDERAGAGSEVDPIRPGVAHGAVQLEGTLREGVWDGELVVYHPNGRVRYMGSFAKGERCGPWIENADSTPTPSTYEALVREVETMGLYPPCDGSS